MTQQSHFWVFIQRDKILKRICAQVHRSFVHYSQDMDAVCPPTQTMDEENVCTYNEVLFKLKKEGNPASFATWVDLEGIMLNEISQIQKDKYLVLSLYEVKGPEAQIE